MILLIWSKIPNWGRLTLAMTMIGILCFGIGRYTKPVVTITKTDTVVKEVQVKDENYTQQAIKKYVDDHHDLFTIERTVTQKVIVPCSVASSTNPTCKLPCAADCSQCPRQTIEETTHEIEHHNASEHSTDGSTTTTTDTAHTQTNTDTHTTTVVQSRSLGGIHISGVASLTLYNQKIVVTPTYGIGIAEDIIGPISIGASVYTDRTAFMSISFRINQNWSISGSAGMHFQDIQSKNFGKAFYGGSLDRKILGPVYVGVWAYSDRSAGLAASITVP